jgi:hypothetical protein
MGADQAHRWPIVGRLTNLPPRLRADLRFGSGLVHRATRCILHLNWFVSLWTNIGGMRTIQPSGGTCQAHRLPTPWHKRTSGLRASFPGSQLQDASDVFGPPAFPGQIITVGVPGKRSQIAAESKPTRGHPSSAAHPPQTARHPRPKRNRSQRNRPSRSPSAHPMQQPLGCLPAKLLTFVKQLYVP